MRGASTARTNDVLVVEDDEETRDMLVDILRSRGFGTDDAASGEAAIASCLHAAGERRGAPRVVLLDLMLPDMHGQQVAAAITRSLKVPPEFIVLSAQPLWLIARAGREIGARDCLRKPFDIERLVGSITRAANDAGPLTAMRTHSGVSAELLVAIRTFEARVRPLSEGPPSEQTWRDARRVVERATHDFGFTGISALGEDVRVSQMAFHAVGEVESCFARAHVSDGAADLDFAITDAHGYALLQLVQHLCRHLGATHTDPRPK